jgi:hypothetical protein
MVARVTDQINVDRCSNQNNTGDRSQTLSKRSISHRQMVGAEGR